MKQSPLCQVAKIATRVSGGPVWRTFALSCATWLRLSTHAAFAGESLTLKQQNRTKSTTLKQLGFPTLGVISKMARLYCFKPRVECHLTCVETLSTVSKPASHCPHSVLGSLGRSLRIFRLSQATVLDTSILVEWDAPSSQTSEAFRCT